MPLIRRSSSTGSGSRSVPLHAAARHQLRGRARRGARPARAQRRGQDDDGGHPVDADAGRTAAAPWSPGMTWSSDPAGVRRSIMLTGQHVALDDMLTGPREPGDVRSAAGAEEVGCAIAGRGTSRPVRPGPCGGPAWSARIPVGCAGGSISPADWWSAPKWCSSTNPPPDWIRAAGRVSGTWWPTSKRPGIATLLTTQYLEEADALSDRIIVIDHGTIIAEGTADELKERTGGDLLRNRSAPSERSARHGRGARSAAAGEEPGGADTGIRPHRDARARRPEHPVEALHRLDAANIELLDIALRRPSLDEVFLALTTGRPRRRGQTESDPIAAADASRRRATAASCA